MNAPDIPKGTENFWEWNPEYVELFEDTALYTTDKSKKKVKSSQIVWAFYHKTHPDSIYRNFPDKEDKIKEKFLKDPKFSFDDYTEELQLFKESVLEQGARSLVEFEDTLRRRDAFLRTQEYTLGTAKELDAILANTAKLYQVYENLKKDYQEEKIKRGKGSKIESASDAGRI